MTKTELLKELSAIYSKLEEVEQNAEEVHIAVRGLRSKVEDLPTEVDEIEDDPKEQLDWSSQWEGLQGIS